MSGWKKTKNTWHRIRQSAESVHGKFTGRTALEEVQAYMPEMDAVNECMATRIYDLTERLAASEKRTKWVPWVAIALCVANMIVTLAVYLVLRHP